MLSVLHVERVVGVLALAGMYLEHYRATRTFVLDGTRQTRLLILVLIAVLISVPFAYWRSHAMNGLIDFLKLIAWYLLTIHLLDTRFRLRIYLTAFLVLIGYIALDSVRAYFTGSYIVRMGIERALGQTEAGGDPNHLAATMAATIPLLLLLAFYKPLRWLRHLSFAGALLLTVTMSLTGSRSGLLGFFGGLLFVWWRVRHRLLVGLLGVAILGGGFVFLPQQYKTRYATIGQSQLDGSSRGRITAWEKGVRMILDRPLTGVGIDCFGTANALGYSSEGQESYLEAHSLYVQVPAEVGLIGGLAFFGFLFEALRVNRKAVRELRSAGADWQFETTVLQGLSAGIFALLITGIFGHSFMRYTWYVYAALGTTIWRLFVDRHSKSLVNVGTQTP